MFANFLKRIFARSPAKADPVTAQTGRRGEDLAAEFLRRKGLRIVERNWRCPLGELDIICRDRETLVFVEVKSSLRLSLRPPESRVHHTKQRKLTTLALYYLKHRAVDAPCRFDVIAVWWEDGKPQIRHYENAFPRA